MISFGMIRKRDAHKETKIWIPFLNRAQAARKKNTCLGFFSQEKIVNTVSLRFVVPQKKGRKASKGASSFLE